MKGLGGQGFKMRIKKMPRMTKKALLSLARDLNATDFTYDHEVRKGCENLIEVAYSAGVNGWTGCIFKDQDGNFYVIKSRSSAVFRLWYLSSVKPSLGACNED